MPKKSCLYKKKMLTKRKSGFNNLKASLILFCIRYLILLYYRKSHKYKKITLLKKRLHRMKII